MKASWLAYLSGFPHVNLYFRNSLQYANQTAVINGRKATTDLNLYKLFLEQCTHLLTKGARCGIVIPSGIHPDFRPLVERAARLVASRPGVRRVAGGGFREGSPSLP